MKPVKVYRIRLEAVTPLFIGDGDSLKPLSYVIGENEVYVLRSDRFFAVLSPAEQKRYVDWIEPLFQQVSELDEQIRRAREARNRDEERKLRKQQRNLTAQLSVGNFIRQKLSRNPLHFLKQHPEVIAYAVPFAVKPGSEGFRTFIKDASSRPYIPGTEIKGALRMALLYRLLMDERAYNLLETKLENFWAFFQGGAQPRKKAKKLAKVASDIEDELLRGQVKDAKYDFFKLVQVADTPSWPPESTLRVEVTHSTGTTRFTRMLVEAIVPGTSCEFDLTLSEGMELALERLGLRELGEWLHPNKLFEASYERSKAILEEEEAFFSSEPAIARQIALLKRMNEPDAPLLRLGWGQGLLSTTVDLHIKRRNPALYEKLRKSLSSLRRWRTQPGNFPKTRKVVTDSRGRPVSLLGWVKLSKP